MHALAWNIQGRAAAARYAVTRDRKDADKARHAFTRAVETNPTFWPALQNLAELEERDGRLREAAALYGKVLAAEPNHPDKGRFEKVIAASEK